MLVGATVRDNEYGWKLESFSPALLVAERFGLACLGGQIQFQFEDAIFEVYWLSADSSKRVRGESWHEYVHRSCNEVANEFRDLTANLNVQQVIQQWPGLQARMEAGSDPFKVMCFVAYFVTEAEYLSLRDAV